MTRVRIFRSPKTAMQSGTGNTKKWILEFDPESPKRIDPLMGWTGSSDMRQQVRLSFVDRDDAVAYAKRAGYAYEVDEPAPRRHVVKNYADKFAWNKAG